ncbi:hypothetical protein ACFQZQ_13260 [Lysobacter koreensis]|uniref:Uncharacterized protein n=1 Tax=Lysobacter koreensis TaxID=266122 RepID=A0ABW2YQT3_9GAMM
MRLTEERLFSCGVIPWASPIVFFGDAERAKVATVGINPSNREFVDEVGQELEGTDRRFPTLRSLGRKSWADCDDQDIDCLLEHGLGYFSNRPYGLWFNKLEALISQTGSSYYNTLNPACHLDIIPYATGEKWMSLTGRQKNALLSEAGDTLGAALAASEIELLILNGSSVVNAVSRIFNLELSAFKKTELDLPRRATSNVAGLCYEGNITEIRGHSVDRSIKVIGFNHNIQSSFGVTSDVIKNLSKWVGSFSRERQSAAC